MKFNFRLVTLTITLLFSLSASAQFKYQNGRVLIGNATAFGSYPI